MQPAYDFVAVDEVQTYVPYLAFGNILALMVFWYDGFIWSVQKRPGPMSILARLDRRLGRRSTHAIHHHRPAEGERARP